LTGGLSPNGKAALLAMQIWEADQNAKGGLLGRPVKLVYYDDQTDASTVPGIYTKLLDVDKVDLVVGPYATNMIAPAMPVIIQHNMTFIGLLGLAVNTAFNYPNYFAMIPSGPDPKLAFTKGFFDIALAQNPKPKTVAIVGADAEFSKNLTDGARTNAQALGLTIVYDKSYPPSTTDYTPIMRAINATNPDLIIVGSYPPDTVGMINALGEVGTKAKMFGGGMVGLQATALKTKLGPMLNGVVNYDFWLPGAKMEFPGTQDLLTKYQAQAAAAGVDPLGYYMTTGPSGGRGRRSLGLLHDDLRLRLSPDHGRSGDQDRRPRPAEDRRLHPRQHLPHRDRGCEVRRGRRMGAVARAAGPVPARHQQRRRPVQGHPKDGDSHPGDL